MELVRRSDTVSFAHYESFYNKLKAFVDEVFVFVPEGECEPVERSFWELLNLTPAHRSAVEQFLAFCTPSQVIEEGALTLSKELQEVYAEPLEDPYNFNLKTKVLVHCNQGKSRSAFVVIG